MTDAIVLDATVRNQVGRGSSRRLRRSDFVPAVIYGGDAGPVSITLAGKQIRRCSRDETFYSQIMNIQVDGKEQQVLLKALQRHPAKENVMHMDFLRVLATQEVTMHIPLHFLNEEACKGVKEQGGAITHMRVEVEVTCLPAALPRYIEVDMLEVKMGSMVRLSNLTVPEGVVLTALAHVEGDDQVVASVHTTRATSEGEEEADSVENVVDKDKESKDSKETKEKPAKGAK